MGEDEEQKEEGIGGAQKRGSPRAYPVTARSVRLVANPLTIPLLGSNNSKMDRTSSRLPWAVL